MTSHAERIAHVAGRLQPAIQRVDDVVHWTMDERLAHYKTPGVAVAVIENGALAWAEGFGVRELQTRRPVEADSVFMGASISKPVTAVMLMQAVERGLIDLDVDVNRYMRRWQLPGNAFTRDNPVTFRRCMAHVAGLSVNGWPMWFRGRPVPSIFNLLDATPHTDLAPIENEFPMPPVRVNTNQGVSARYSGAGFLLAQIALEDVTGRTFDDLAEEFVFGPLGMRRTTFTQPMPDPLRPHVADGHHASGEPIPGGWMVSAEMAAGGIITTAPDYARFMIGFRNAWLGAPGAIMKAATAREMTDRRLPSAWGVGWRVLGEGPSLRVNHGGSNDGYQSDAYLYLDPGAGAVVLTNGVGGIFLHREILGAVAEVYGWRDFNPAPKRVVTIGPEDQHNYVGEYDILSGTELPTLMVFVEDGQLKSRMPGNRMGVRPLYLDDNGVLFNGAGAMETRPTYGPDGRVAELVVYEAGGLETMRLRRRVGAAEKRRYGLDL